eukprot:7582941-Pyramimonas_sp.AAC.1
MGGMKPGRLVNERRGLALQDARRHQELERAAGGPAHARLDEEIDDAVLADLDVEPGELGLGGRRAA